VLELTAEVTDMHGGVSNEVYARALQVLGEQYVAAALLAIVAINAWNRVGVATQMVPPTQ
jgi:alkylhydroperoxidase family enzyme